MPPGRCHPADATQPASVGYTFEALAGSWVSVSAPAVSRIMGGAQSEKNIGEMTFGGGIFNVVSLKYIGKRHLVITYTLKERNNIN